MATEDMATYFSNLQLQDHKYSCSSNLKIIGKEHRGQSVPMAVYVGAGGRGLEWASMVFI